jgi:uncharacterized protein
MSTQPPATLEAPARPVWTPEMRAAIDTAVERLVAEFHPEQIWLFGSYAWGEPTADSDLDFLVIVSESEAHPLDRMQRAHRCLRGVRTPMDVLVPTKEEFERVRNVKPSLTYKIVREGRLVYG